MSYFRTEHNFVSSISCNNCTKLRMFFGQLRSVALTAAAVEHGA